MQVRAIYCIVAALCLVWQSPLAMAERTPTESPIWLVNPKFEK
jgi:hypothetical protein